jgi:hypothetical protein
MIYSSLKCPVDNKIDLLLVIFVDAEFVSFTLKEWVLSSTL